MRKFVVAAVVAPVVVVTAVAVGFVVGWFRDRRLGSAWMNRVTNPFLVRRGIAGRGAAEIGTLEHVGRRSGTRRLTPVHPVATPDGFRIPVPLGLESRWAQNVLAAGHCRLQLHDVVYELDEPRLLPLAEIPAVTGVARLLGSKLGFMYLELHTFAQAPGALEPVEWAGAAGAAGAPEASSAERAREPERTPAQ